MSIRSRIRSAADRQLNELENPDRSSAVVKKNFPALGVRVEDGMVRGTALFGLAADREPIGALAGAEAVVTGDSGLRLGRAAFHTASSGPVGLFMVKRKAYALVGCADGTMHERKLEGRPAIGQAQREAAEFNMLARARARS